MWFVAVHGYVTMPQIRLFAFEGWNDWGQWESVSEQAVYRRLKILCDAGLLAHQRTWYGDHGIYRATRVGLETVGLDLAPSRLDRRDYDHDLRVVDLALGLTDYSCEGWITERQIRGRIRPGMSIGRVPDGLLLGPGGERWAAELEISGKEAQRYHDACDRYAVRHRDHIPNESPDWDSREQLDDYIESGGEIDGVAWYFFSDKKRRRALAAAEKVIAVREHDSYRTKHLHFRFHGADRPAPPPFEKWEEQQWSEREAEEREFRRREEERKRLEAEARRTELYREAWGYLTEKERERAVETAVEESRRRGRRPTEEEKQQAIVDAGRAKYKRDQDRDERRRRRKDAIRDFSQFSRGSRSESQPALVSSTEGGRRVYEVTIHFVDGREPVGFLAAEFDVWPDARDEDNGLQRYACVAPGGERAAVCLNPGSVAAIVPAFVEPERWSGIATLEKASDRTRPVGTRRPEGEQESGAGKDPTAFRNRRKPDMADLQWGCFPRNEELEREILSFLARFGAATPRQLMRWHPLRRHFIDGEGRYSLAVERFLFSEERACDYLDAMRREGLVTSDAPHFRSRTDSVIRPTDEGAELAGMGSLPRPYVGVADAGDYYPKMVDLYQGIMGSLHEDAAWVTNRELRSAVITAARERELDRKLPSLLPSPHKFWPDAPEGVLVLKKSGTVAAVGLETTQVSKGRMAAYETIFETFSRDRALDRAYFFFVREKARLRVEKLVERHQRDGFFVFRDYRAEDPLGTSEGQHPMQTPV